VQGAVDSSVLIQGLKIVEQERGPARGVALQCPVGGAAASPRSVHVQLDCGLVTYSDPGGEVVKPFSFALKKGEVETFHISAESEHEAHCWTADLLLVVNGKRKIIRIDDNGQAFRTSGMDGLKVYVWNGHDWVTSGQ
jgi:hypothetical protein